MQCENIFSSFKTWSCYTCTLVGNLPKNVSREFSMSQFTYYIHALCGCSSMGNWTRCKKFKDDRPLLPKKIYILTLIFLVGDSDWQWHKKCEFSCCSAWIDTISTSFMLSVILADLCWNMSNHVDARNNKMKIRVLLSWNLATIMSLWKNAVETFWIVCGFNWHLIVKDSWSWGSLFWNCH